MKIGCILSVIGKEYVLFIDVSASVRVTTRTFYLICSSVSVDRWQGIWDVLSQVTQVMKVMRGGDKLLNK